MNKTDFINEDTFFERILELVKNEKSFKFYVKDKSKNEPKFFKSSYKHECGHIFLFVEFGENWSQMMLWKDSFGNPITWDDIRDHLLSFISDHTLQGRTYSLDESSIK